MRTPVFSHELSSYWSRYCCDPFKHHRRHIYSHLRVVPASLIAEHPSLSLHSGVVACCNCLKAIRECSPESRAPDVPLLECAGPSNEHAGSSNEHAGSSNERAGPSNERHLPVLGMVLGDALGSLEPTCSLPESAPARHREYMRPCV